MSEHHVGAFTGEIAAVMLKSSRSAMLFSALGRRHHQKETDACCQRLQPSTQP
jgi:triosephosphate isomerase